MDLNTAFRAYLPWIEAELHALLAVPGADVARHYAMLQYHMGWLDAGLRPAAAPAGKRIRPVLCLLACAACGADPQRAVPAAAGLELLHNFSLLHDDIEDNSPTRRHRPAAWALFGLPLALNAGDAMFGIAFRAFQRLPGRGVDPAVALEALRVFGEMCVALTEGQFLDMSFEQRADVGVEEYFRMIEGKTAALLAAAAEIGALLAHAAPALRAEFRRYGRGLGVAFQLQDDILGIWGDEAQTGKPAAGDILSKKKSLPVLHALADPHVGPELQALYAGPPFEPGSVPAVLALLDAAGARPFTEARAAAETEAAHEALRHTHLAAEAVAGLDQLLDALTGRRS